MSLMRALTVQRVDKLISSWRCIKQQFQTNLKGQVAYADYLHC